MPERALAGSIARFHGDCQGESRTTESPAFSATALRIFPVPPKENRRRYPIR